ncbi:MAG TPA: amidohydrolase family protein [Candidatus Dormibacteraeota bacterium]|nr:amidohydrolase family protein [Candidatus Dormibacteraeota bacterium]
MLIDLHAHVIPTDLPPARGRASGDRWPRIEPAETGGARVLVSGPMRFTARDVFYDADRRLEAMERSGVDAEVLSPMPPLLNYALPAQDGLDLARCVNEFIARLREAAPDRFLGLGTVPLQDPDLAARELAVIKGMGLHGVEIGSNVEGRSLGEDRFLGFFQEAERLGVPIFVHALPAPLGDRMPRSAVPSFGVGTEAALAAVSIIYGGVAERCPGLRLALSHGAGGFPLMLPRAQYFWGGTWNEEPPSADRPQVPDRLPRSPSEYARRFYYDTLVFDRRALRYLLDLIGPERLLVGTDFPAMERERPAGRTLRSMDLPGEVLEDITWNNCFRFLGLPPPR